MQRWRRSWRRRRHRRSVRGRRSDARNERSWVLRIGDRSGSAGSRSEPVSIARAGRPGGGQVAARPSRRALLKVREARPQRARLSPEPGPQRRGQHLPARGARAGWADPRHGDERGRDASGPVAPARRAGSKNQETLNRYHSVRMPCACRSQCGRDFMRHPPAIATSASGQPTPIAWPTPTTPGTPCVCTPTCSRVTATWLSHTPACYLRASYTFWCDCDGDDGLAVWLSVGVTLALLCQRRRQN